jgi:hypothetical protein
MKKNEMMAIETIAKGLKGAYQKPMCTSFRMDTESMICSSVRGETVNKNVSEDENDPWFTHQGN